MKQRFLRIQGALRSRINSLAHLLAQRHETRLRASLLAQLQAAANEGKTLDELHSLLDTMEAAP